MSDEPSAAPWSPDASTQLAELVETFLRQAQEAARLEAHADDAGMDAFTASPESAITAESVCPQPGACLPCSWQFHYPGCCPRGAACPFCHVHTALKTVRPCKSKRQRLEKAKAKLDKLATADPANLSTCMFEVPPACKGDPFLLKEYRAYVAKVIARHTSVVYSV